MKSLDELAEGIINNKSNSNKNIAEHLIKLQEESGELAVAYLMSKNKKGHSKTKKEIEDNFLEEACDCILVLLSLLGKAKYSKKEAVEMLYKKREKYNANRKKYGF